MQWAKLNNVALSQPRIESPSSMSGEGTNIKMTPDALQKQDGSANWLLYWTSRALWQKTFQERFPEEKEYRHSLAEESEALGVLASAVAKNLKEGTIKSADPALMILVHLYEEGLLEPYILLGKADEGIAQDYASYRKDHRDKLIQYLNEYVAPAATSKK
jgi:hypothetical protein